MLDTNIQGRHNKVKYNSADMAWVYFERSLEG